MRATVTSLSLAVMLLHSICGCCWHHDHEHCADNSSTNPYEVACAHGECSHHHGQTPGHSGGTPSDDDCPGPQCEEEACVYVAGRVVELASPLALEFLICSFADTSEASPQSRSLTVELKEPPLFESSMDSCARRHAWRL